MRRIERLKQEGLKAANWRWHNMGRFLMSGLKGSRQATSQCLACNKWLCVEENPAPNSICISGPAVALNCTINTPSVAALNSGLK